MTPQAYLRDDAPAPSGPGACPPAAGLARHARPPRRGIVGVVAMLFLVLFAVLALGFYAAITLSSQVSANERAVYNSQLAAESGMQFIRYHLASVVIPAHRPPDKVLEELHHQLRLRMCGTGNLGVGDVGYDGQCVTVPADPEQFIELRRGGLGFRVSITQTTTWSDSAPAYRLRVKVTGVHGSVSRGLGRALQTEYEMQNVRSTVFDHGVAAMGPVQMKSGPTTRLVGLPAAAASILTASAATTAITTGKGQIDGDLYVPLSTSQVTLGGGSVGQEPDSTAIMTGHVHVTRPPDFPTVHTVIFSEMATNPYVPGSARQKNIRVPPNTHPTFSTGDVIDGILYIESPNTVTFSGHTDINGVVVLENKGTVSENVLDFKGNVTHSAIPDTPEFAALKARAAGLAIAAPTASVTLSSSVDSVLTGSIIAGKVTIAGSADVTLTNGSVIALGGDPVLVEGKTVRIEGSASAMSPYAAVRFDGYFRPLPGTYTEVMR